MKQIYCKQESTRLLDYLDSLLMFISSEKEMYTILVKLKKQLRENGEFPAGK